MGPRCEEVLRARARAFFPCIPKEKFDNADLRVGGRPWTSDDLPCVGGTRFMNLWLNTGHGHVGWKLSCRTAELLVFRMRGGARAPCGVHLGSLSLGRYEPLWSVADQPCPP